MLRGGDLLKLRIFGLNYVLRGCERFLDRIVPEDLVSSSDLEVTFFHKDLHLKNGLQIHLVNQVKMTLKGVRICKRESTPLLATKQMPTTTTPRINPLLLRMPHLVPPPQLGKESCHAMPLTR